jgi:hypothetical protein
MEKTKKQAILHYYSIYAPYSVGVKTSERKKTVLSGVNFTDEIIQVDWLRKNNGCKGEILSFYDGKERGHECYIDYCKLILRGLYCLTKNIDHNGERFIPLTKLEGLYGQTLNTDEANHLVQPITCEPYILIRQLLEWHFDIFGLIEKGLAVPLT